MKKLQLPTAMLGLTVLLTACPQPSPPQNEVFTLTVNLSGVTSAPVQVTNTTTNTVLNEGTLSSGKTFSGLNAGTVLKIEPGAVNGYTAPATQTVTLDANKTVTLEYKVVAQPGEALDQARIKGQVTDTTLQLDEAFIGTSSNPFFGPTKLTRNTLDLNLAALTIPAQDLRAGIFSSCNVQQSAPDARLFFSITLAVFGPQGDRLGDIAETVVAGPDAQLQGALLLRVYADRATTIKGTCTTSNGGTETIDLSLRPGWNAVVTGKSGNTLVTRMADFASRVQLTFLNAEKRVPVDLGTQPLSFTTNETATVEAEFIQVGGYSGQVNLSTNVPGLTVEPTTLQLPALATLSTQRTTSPSAALGLTPQLVKTRLTFRYTGNNYNGPFELLVKDTSGKTVGSGKGTLNVQRPSFAMNQGSTNAPLFYVAESGNLPVTVTARGGFNGSVQVNFENLPAGFTSAARNVTANGTGNLPLNVSDSVAPGNYNLTLVGTSGSLISKAPVTVTVKPRRIALNSAPIISMELAPNGDLWALQGQMVIRVRQQVIVDTYSLPAGTTGGHIRVGAGGAVWVKSNERLYSLTGNSFQERGATGFPSNTSFAVDAQGRAWYMFFNGFNVPELRRLDSQSGTPTTVAVVKSAQNGVEVMNDAAGKNVVFVAADGSLVRVDTATDQSVASATPLASTMEVVRFLVNDRQGQLWAAVSSPMATLKRLDLATMSVAQTVNINSVSNEDGGYARVIIDGNAAWFARTSPATVTKLNLSTLAKETFTLDLPTQSLNALSLAPSEGAAYAFYDNSGVPTSYLRFLK